MIIILPIVACVAIVTMLYFSSTDSEKFASTFDLPCSISYQADIPTLKLNKSHNELPQELVFFLKSNSTGHICIRYSSESPLNERLLISNIPYVALIKTGSVQNQPTSDITVNVSPPTIDPNKTETDTIVKYTISASKSTGVYRMPISFICYSNDIPIVVWAGEPQVNSSDIKMWFGPEHGNCKSPIANAQIVGYDGGSLEYHDITPVIR